jgi:hypothetical protein
MTDSSTSARRAVEAIIARDGLHNLAAEDVERLVALYMESAAEMAQLRAPEVATAEPAVTYRAE